MCLASCDTEEKNIFSIWLITAAAAALANLSQVQTKMKKNVHCSTVLLSNVWDICSGDKIAAFFQKKSEKSTSQLRYKGIGW